MSTAPSSIEQDPRGGGRTARWLAGALALLAVALLVSGVVPRMARARRLAAQASAVDAPPVVTVASPTRGTTGGALVLPGTIFGLHEAALHARASGYVTRISVDIGTAVRAGDVLATLDMPEVEQELLQARATLEQLQASGELARATRDRWQGMVAQNAATRQEFDEKQAAFNVTGASIRAARANVERLAATRRFGRIVAPFSGVITARNVDVGALVSPGSATATRPLFQLAQVDRLRVVTQVPQSAAAAVRVGSDAEIVVQELGTATFIGRVTRTARALDAATRSLLVEIEVANRDGRLMPGMFARVTLDLARDVATLRIPANTLVMRADGPHVAVVRGDSVETRLISLGRDFGTEIEVLDGVTESDRLVVNPGDAARPGARVRVAAPKPDSGRRP